MRKHLLLVMTLLFTAGLFAQTDTVQTNDSGVIKVHFLYGSKPKRKYKKTESTWFGGIHGGHVSIETEGKVYGFVPVKSLHVVQKNYNKHSAFTEERLKDWVQDTATLKYTTITIPVSRKQIDSLDKIHASYLKEPPYDYAFIGMRCAAATYDILGQIGIVDWVPNRKNTFKNFYPKLLRAKLLKLAEERGYKVYRQPGRETRIWEDD